MVDIPLDPPPESEDWRDDEELQALALASIAWSASRGAYVDLTTGSAVSQDLVLKVVEARINEGFDRLGAMARAVIEGDVSIEEFQAAGLAELRRAHTQMAALGRGGWEQMQASEWGKVGAQLRFEYERWRLFMEAVARGDLSYEAIVARLGMYADHIWTSYWSARTAGAIAAGAMTEARYTTAAESCPDCIAYEKQGRVPVGTLPEPGQQSECQAHCKCGKRYYDAQGFEI